MVFISDSQDIWSSKQIQVPVGKTLIYGEDLSPSLPFHSGCLITLLDLNKQGRLWPPTVDRWTIPASMGVRTLDIGHPLGLLRFRDYKSEIARSRIRINWL